jgi:tetratricopeptide (TPR) repeat protein
LIGGMLCSLGGTLYYQGKFAESLALTTEAAELYEKIGKHTVAITVRGNLAAIALAQGELAAAREHAEIAVRLSSEAGDEQQLAVALANLGEALFRSGDIGRARVTLEDCLQLAESIKKPQTATEALYLLACIDIAEQRSAEALANILRLRNVLTEYRLDVRAPLLVLAAAEWLLSTGIEIRTDALRWLEALLRLDDIDATLRDKARQLLERETATGVEDAREREVGLSLPELEREVVAFLAGVAQDPKAI